VGNETGERIDRGLVGRLEGAWAGATCSSSISLGVIDTCNIWRAQSRPAALRASKLMSVARRAAALHGECWTTPSPPMQQSLEGGPRQRRMCNQGCAKHKAQLARA